MIDVVIQCLSQLLIDKMAQMRDPFVHQKFDTCADPICDPTFDPISDPICDPFVDQYVIGRNCVIQLLIQLCDPFC